MIRLPNNSESANNTYCARRHARTDVSDTGQYSEALEKYTESITLDPNDAKAGCARVMPLCLAIPAGITSHDEKIHFAQLNKKSGG